MRADWESKPLGDLCAFQRGLTYGKSDEVEVSSNVVLRANNVDLATHTLDLSDLRYIADSVSVPAAKKVCRGSLLICTASGSKSHVGKIAYIDEDYGYGFGGFMGQITPAACIDGRFLFYALTSPTYKNFIEALSDGVNINNLKFDDLRQFAVPVPPLPEQRRIVAILDEAFEAIATAKANAEKNLQNARELFESCLDATLSRHAAGYTGTSLGAEIELLAGYAFSSALYTDAHRSVRLLRGDNIMQGYLRRTRPRVGHRVIARNTLDSRCVKATLSLLWTAHGSRPGLSGHKCRRTTYLVYLFSVRRDFGLNRQ